MSNNGGEHTNFNGAAFGAAGFGGGLCIASAIMHGVMNHRARMADRRRQEAAWNRVRTQRFNAANATQLGLRLNIEVEKNATLALANVALRAENQRLRRR